MSGLKEKADIRDSVAWDSVHRYQSSDRERMKQKGAALLWWSTKWTSVMSWTEDEENLMIVLKLDAKQHQAVK